MGMFIGCDLGGTNFRAALIDPQTGQVLVSQQIPTQAWEGHSAVMDRMAGLIQAVIQSAGVPKSEVGAVGIGVPGVLDLENGLTLFLPNLPGTWPGVPLRDTIAGLTGLPVALLNDVRAITFGEWKLGAGRGVDTMACFAIGTGVGGGLVVNGQLHLGIGGTAGELGHMTIDPHGPLCGCGNRGCLETFASGPAIAAMGMKAVSQGLTTRITKLVEHDLNQITPEVICRAALDGDAIAQSIYEEAGRCLGIAIANILITLSPRKVVIAGGVAQAGDLLLNPIRRTVQERVFVMPKEQVQIVLAQLGSNAGVIGAALWAAQSLGVLETHNSR